MMKKKIFLKKYSLSVQIVPVPAVVFVVVEMGVCVTMSLVMPSQSTVQVHSYFLHLPSSQSARHVDTRSPCLQSALATHHPQEAT